MSTGLKLIVAAIVVVILVAAPTQAGDLVGDLFAGVLQFVKALG